MSDTASNYMKQMQNVAKAIQELYQKYNEYTSFTYTCGTESTNNNEYYEKWNIYTPTISHNTFKTSAELINFIIKMVKDESGLYKNCRRVELLEELKHYEKLIDDAKYQLSLLEKDENEIEIPE